MFVYTDPTLVTAYMANFVHMEVTLFAGLFRAGKRDDSGVLGDA
ncbi:hypothetical protein [Halospeciosus flavus]|uniref:Uncharacterized protein n=1 Tax=Halospeciosus flavus TaxID=3032283 RepID=A0ABD5Z231_9EURY|nr:hypothetical protein [Halospeciosus flavus]